jgi:DNA-binding MarR family transcriptional regulator
MSRGHREQLLRELGDEVRASQRATDTVDELVCELLGINRTDGRCLDILDQHGRMTAGRLGELSGLSSGAVTGVIDRLERGGYARRVPDPDDRRRVLVELTPKTQTLAWELMGGPMSDAAQPIIKRYTVEQLEMLLDFTRRGRQIQERHADWLRSRLEGSQGPTGF